MIWMLSPFVSPPVSPKSKRSMKVPLADEVLASVVSVAFATGCQVPLAGFGLSSVVMTGPAIEDQNGSTMKWLPMRPGVPPVYADRESSPIGSVSPSMPTSSPGA